MELYLSLGSNLGDRGQNLATAVNLLDQLLPGERKAMSDVIETEPWGFECSNKFLNAVVVYEIEFPVCDETGPCIASGSEGQSGISASDPEAVTDACEGLLDICKAIESAMGREEELEFDQAGNRIYHSRTIDIDILLCGGINLHTDRLVIPHPLMTGRDFVMVPLLQVASEEVRGMLDDIRRNPQG